MQGDPDLAQYEHDRLHNIERNNAFLRRLGLQPDMRTAEETARQYAAPYHHRNLVDAEVQRTSAALARVMGSAAKVIERYSTHAFAAMWAPILAAPVIAPIFVSAVHRIQTMKAEQHTVARTSS